MPYVRQTVNGATPLDLKAINDNYQTLWLKVFGNLDMSDTNTAFENQLYTHQLPFQGEGNLDTSHPMYIRFFVPSNTRKIKSAKFSVMTSRYRMDSSVTSTAPQVVSGGGTTSTSEYLGEVITSLENTIATVQSTAYVETWGPAGSDAKAPTGYVTGVEQIAQDTEPLWEGIYPGLYRVAWTAYDQTQPLYLLTRAKEFTMPGDEVASWIDMMSIQHRHKFTVSIPAHAHGVSIPPHHHTFSVQLTVPAHGHDLVPGIIDSSVAVSDLKVYINDVNSGITLNDNAVQNDIDITNKVNIGQWNVLQVTASSLARVTIYGIVETLENH